MTRIILSAFTPFLLFSGFGIGLSIQASDDSTPASQASEQEPDASVRGVTYDKGPNKYFKDRCVLPFLGCPAKESKCDKGGSRPDCAACETCPSKSAEKSSGCCGSKEDNGIVMTEAMLKDQKRMELQLARQRVELETRMQAAIRRLSTSGWREAQTELVDTGKAAIPFLIDAMDSTAQTSPAYNLGGHTKADAGRATRQRTLAEICAEVLTDLVSNHSDYKGVVPPVDKDAWAKWWSDNASSITFAK